MGPLVRHALSPARPVQTLALMLALSLAVHAMALGLLARWPAAQPTAAAIAPAELVVVLVGDEVDVRAAAPVASQAPASSPAGGASPARPLRTDARPPRALVATAASDTVRVAPPMVADAVLPPHETSPAAGAAAVLESSPDLGEPAAPVSAPASVRPSSPIAYRDAPPPEYPESARRDGAQGLVVLDVTVSPEGTPLDVAVAQSSGVATLDAAAVSAVIRWRFAPARRDGDAVEARIRIPVRFRLTNDGR